MNRHITHRPAPNRPFPKLLLFFSILALILAFNGAQSEELTRPRVALVIGNSEYNGSITRLINPTNDANAIAHQLTATGFDVIKAIDQDRNGIIEAVATFRKRLKPGGVALFYYAGHGVSVNNTNYLIPLRSGITHSEDVPLKAINIHQILSTMERNNGYKHGGLNVMILDACRNNPFTAGRRSLQAGLSKIEAATGSLI